MSQAICKFPFAYPHNLVCEIYGAEVQRDELPPDIDDSVEYVLETQMDERNAFILILRYLRLGCAVVRQQEEQQARIQQCAPELRPYAEQECSILEELLAGQAV